MNESFVDLVNKFYEKGIDPFKGVIRNYGDDYNKKDITRENNKQINNEKKKKLELFVFVWYIIYVRVFIYLLKPFVKSKVSKLLKF